MSSCRDIISSIFNNAEVIQAVDKALNANTSNNEASTSHGSQAPAQEPQVEAEVRRLFRGRVVPSLPPRFTAQQNISQLSKRSSSRISAKRGRQSGICGPNTFTKDLVLLADHMVDAVPRRGNKQWLFSNGHVKNAVEICKNWDSIQVLNHFRTVFKDKLDKDTQIEILMALHNKVLKPNLVGDQTLSGIMIHKVFTSKAIYLRPSKMILACVPREPDQQNTISDSDMEDSDFTGNKEILEQSLELERTVANQMQQDPEQKESEPPACDWLYHATPILEQQSLATEIFSAEMERQPQNMSGLATETCAAVSSILNISNFDMDHAASISFQTPQATDQSEYVLTDPYNEYIHLLDNVPLEDIEVNVSQENIVTLESSQESVLLEDILRNISQNINEDKISMFNVNRSNIWEGATRGFKRSSYSPLNKMSVKFTDDVGTSEGAVDLGGPRREFLQLLMKYIKHSCMFTGPENEKCILQNSTAMRNDDYFIAGRAIAVCLVHGGPPPHFFSKEMFEALVQGPENVKFEWNTIPDEGIKAQLQAIVQAPDLNAAKEAVENAEQFLDLAGCLRPITSLEIAKQVVADATNWFFIGRSRGAFERLKEGLETLDMLELINKFPESFRVALCKSHIQMKWHHIDSMFIIQLSSPGSNKRVVQERVIGWWRDYIVDIDDGDSKITLGELLSFATGTNQPPALGWDVQPSLSFDSTGNVFPHSNTCSNILYLPIVLTSFEQFKEKMDFAVQNSPGFGQP